MTERRTELQVVRAPKGVRLASVGPRDVVLALPRPGQWVVLSFGYVRGPDRALYMRCYGVFGSADEAHAHADTLEEPAAGCGPLTAAECRSFRFLPDGKLYDRVRKGSDEDVPWWDGRAH